MQSLLPHRLLLALILAQIAGAATPVEIGFPVQLPLGARRYVELEFPTEAGKIYQVEVSEDMETWVNDGYAIPGTGEARIHISSTWDLPALFFRVTDKGDPKRVIAGGIPGPTGPVGDPITGYATAAQGAKADTALQPGYTPGAIEAQAFWAALNGTSLRDRFDRPERYAEGDKIIHLSSMPEVGHPWRLSVHPSNNPDLQPYVDKGGFRSANNALYYLGNSVASPGKKFSLFFEFAMEPTQAVSALKGLTMNVSFNSKQMVSDGGGIFPSGVVHVNWSEYGINFINFFPGSQVYGTRVGSSVLTFQKHQFQNGDGFYLNPGKPPSPLLADTLYYANVISDTEIRVAATKEDALAGITINLSPVPTAPQFFRYEYEEFRAINRERISSTYHWHPGKKPLIANKRYVMFIKAEGEVVEIGIAGVGSILFENSQLPSHVGAERTDFWWEAGGTTSSVGGVSKRYISKLHSIWSLPDLNTSWLSSFGGEPLPLLGSAGPYNFRGAIKSFGADTLQMAAPLPPFDIRFFAGANGTLVRGDQRIAQGGHAFVEGGYLSNVGAIGNGMELVGRAPMAIDNNLINPVRSPAAANNAPLHSLKLTPTLEPGDSEEFQYYGMLNGTQTKRILLTSQIGGQVLFDSDTVSPPLAEIEGPFTITLFRHVRAGGANTCFAKFQAAGASHLQRSTPTGLGDNPGRLNFTATAVPVGGVTLEAIRQVVHRVKNN